MWHARCPARLVPSSASPMPPTARATQSAIGVNRQRGSGTWRFEAEGVGWVHQALISGGRSSSLRPVEDIRGTPLIRVASTGHDYRTNPPPMGRYSNAARDATEHAGTATNRRERIDVDSGAPTTTSTTGWMDDHGKQGQPEGQRQEGRQDPQREAIREEGQSRERRGFAHPDHGPLSDIAPSPNALSCTFSHTDPPTRRHAHVCRSVLSHVVAFSTIRGASAASAEGDDISAGRR